MVSALTLFELDEMMARYASYESLAEIIRHRFTNPSQTLKELFSRLVFNILSGNTDDHARNHAAFWDGDMLTLTPAYDICPQGRAGNEASQAMRISGTDNMSGLHPALMLHIIFSCRKSRLYPLLKRKLSSSRRTGMPFAMKLNWVLLIANYFGNDSSLTLTPLKDLDEARELEPYPGNAFDPAPVQNIDPMFL